MKRLLRENYKNIEPSLKLGYNIVFLVKKQTQIEEISFKQIKEDMFKILEKAELIQMD